jgi:hypothetical protein
MESPIFYCAINRRKSNGDTNIMKCEQKIQLSSFDESQKYFDMFFLIIYHLSKDERTSNEIT